MGQFFHSFQHSVQNHAPSASLQQLLSTQNLMIWKLGDGISKLLPIKPCHLPSASSRMESLATASSDRQHPLRGAQGGDQEWGTQGSGKKTGITGLQIDLFRRRFYEPNFLHLLTSRKALKSLMETSAPRNQQQPFWETSIKMRAWPPPLPLWSGSAELFERMFPGLQSSFCPK